MVKGKINMKKRSTHAWVWLGYLVVLVFFLTPIVWTIMTSFKDQQLIHTMKPVFFFKPTLFNYRDIIQNSYIMQFFSNSLFISSIACSVAIVFGTLAAYSFSRFRIKRREDIAFWILSTRMLPPVASVIPIYLIASNLGLLDTYTILIALYASFNIPYVVWIMRGFFADIPREIEEAALVDGCSIFGVFRKIVLPLSIAGLVSTAIFIFVLSINEFIFALVLTSIKSKTVPLAIAALVTDRGVQWGQMSASVTILLVPLIIFYAFIQKNLVRGLTFGAIK
ncbi:MAG: carbohydrate ABC transporter permease [Candidatus Atribacteria bacterium]|nr:carbohydrate ABC transporter permease [Candidatus Atribacteria bacterium]